MKNQDFTCSISANVSPEEAIEAINNVSGWWATNVIGNSQKLNDVFTVRFGKTFATIKIVEIVDTKIVWHVTDSLVPLFKNKKQWNDTKLIWELSTKDNVIKINFTHIGLTPETECYADCVKGWSFYIKESLFKLLTEDKGLAGTGIFTNISNGNRRYEGLLYFKNDPLPEYPENFFFIDVNETNGEQVTKIYSAANYCKENFSSQHLKGDYFMIVENKPLYGNLSPLEDILETVDNNTATEKEKVS